MRTSNSESWSQQFRIDGQQDYCDNHRQDGEGEVVLKFMQNVSIRFFIVDECAVSVYE